MADEECVMCNQTVDNPLELGEKLKHRKLVAHYYCLLLSSNLTQNGDDDEGMLGFLKHDVKIEMQRVRPLLCCYCKKSGASIGCCRKACRKSFHLPCAIKKHCLFEFTDTFRSFCHSHHGLKKPTIVHTPDDICSICLDKMGEYKPVRSVQSPCCNKQMWYHQLCLMQMAQQSGYFFKCPLCNNSDVFRDTLVTQGIFIPDKDASWELEPDAFVELTERPTRCDAELCKCISGREYFVNKENSKYSLIYCKYCGSYCVHKACTNRRSFTCKECQLVTNQSLANRNIEPLELNAENVHRIEMSTDSHNNVGSILNSTGSSERSTTNYSSSNSTCSTLVVDDDTRFETKHCSHELDLSFSEWFKAEPSVAEILVHTKTEKIDLTEITDDDLKNRLNESPENSLENQSDDEDCFQPRKKVINLNKANLFLTDSSSNEMAIHQIATKLCTANSNADSNIDDDEDIKPVILRKSCYNKIVDDNCEQSLMKPTNNATTFRRRKHAGMILLDSSSDEASLAEIENINQRKPKYTKLSKNNIKPLLAENKNQANRSLPATG